MDRFIVKETHISAPDNKKIDILVLYVINVFLACILILVYICVCIIFSR
jgi:hypothetical protein